jgi:hypothetical protein
MVGSKYQLRQRLLKSLSFRIIALYSRENLPSYDYAICKIYEGALIFYQEEGAAVVFAGGPPEKIAM